MKTVRFVTGGGLYLCGIAEISREGLATADAKKIEALRKHPGYGVDFFEVPELATVEPKATAPAPPDAAVEGVIVEPISGPKDMEQELAEVEEQAKIKQEQDDAEQALWTAKAANEADYTQKIRKKGR